MDMTPERWDAISHYAAEVFGGEDDHLRGLMPRALEAGLPDIAVSAEGGRLLSILTSMAGPQGGPARRALELGTLAGYSGVWIARALAPGGRLITIEPEAAHADFSQQSFNDAGVGDRVTILREPALDALPRLLNDPGPGAFDVIFIDAVKSEYPDYWTFARDLVSPGGLVLADNVLTSTHWAVTDAPGSHPSRDGADALNRAVAADDRFESVSVPIRCGVLIARRRPA